jgi:protein-tyrosine-phosphatase
MKMHFLFVCYANSERSPTAERVCRQIAAEHDLEIEASSAGTWQFARRHLTKEIADQADTIFAMDSETRLAVIERYEQDPGKIVCLDISDIERRGERQLEAMVRDKLGQYFVAQGLI